MRVGIFPRWAAGFLAVFLSLAASNFYAVWKLHQLGATTIPSMSAEIRILNCKHKLADSLFLQLSCERKYLLLKDAGLYDQFLEANREFHRYVAQGRVLADAAAERDSFRSIDALQERYETLVQAEVSRFREHRSYDASRYRMKKDTASDAVLQELNNLEKYAWHNVNRKIGMVSEAGASTLRIAAWSSLVTILCALFMSFFVTKSITSPLKRLVNKTREVSAGVFEGDLDIKSPPEISELT
jgi:CHASE3 domain sensor protein